MTLKIIFDANPLVIGKSGVGYYTQGLIQALADNYRQDIKLIGYYFNFAGHKQPAGLPVAPNIQYIGVKLISEKVINLCRRLGFRFPLNLLLRQHADIVLSTNFVPSLYIPKTKRVIAVHDLSFVDTPEYVSVRNLSFLQRWAPRAINSSDLILTISNFTKQRIMNAYAVPDEKLHVTPIPPATHTPADYAIIKKYHLDDDYLLFVGTIEPRKNIVNLLNAYSLMKPDLQKNFPLVLAGGKGWNDEAILARITELQKKGLNIIQTGYISDAEKAALYEKATICIQPSHYEGFGMPVLEAMSYGKPVACSDIAVLCEVGGKAAVYFDKDNPQSITNTLTSLLTNPDSLARLSDRSIAHISSYPTWKKVATGLYDRLVTL